MTYLCCLLERKATQGLLLKGVKREYSNARTLQQNRVAKRKNMTLIEAARTMLADLFLPATFWAEAVNTACYVLNRVLVTKPQNKTPYELLTGKQLIISYLRPSRCHVTILNTIDQLGKFDGKSDSSFLVGYSLNSKSFRVYNFETKRVKENMHVNFLENKPNVAGKCHAWMFDLDYLTNSMNYEPVSIENQADKSAGPKEANNSAGTQANDDQDANSEEIDLHEEHFVLPIWSAYSTTYTISAAGPSRAFNDGELSYPDDPSMSHLEVIYASPSEGIFTDSSYDDEGPKFPNKVYKVVKALYRLHQAPRAWYTTFSTFLEKSRYKRGAVDKTLFIKQDKKDIMLVQVYVDDINFSSTKKSWCNEFEELMKNRFQMSSMRKLTFFLGLQVKQKEDGIFISQDKYVAKILKKFDFLSVKTDSTPIKTQKPLVKGEEAADVDVHLDRSMIGSLMYLTAFRLDIMFVVCACSRF
uniref:Copia protein n=1 Tax=Tanacetum cinerariifolium TaxID=118510 RepID=A0A699GW75_TANCI|nr:copia protein [Tanacetum cinerariifolium]